MAYRSNVDEIPGLVRYLREERLAWSIEVRDTYIVPHLPAEFRDAEFLDMDQWRSLHRALSIYRVQDVMMSLPPGFTPAPADEPVARTHETGVAVPDTAQVSTLADPDRIAKARAARVPGLCEIKMSWTGEATILPALAGDYPSERSDAVHVNIAEIDDPPAYFLSLLAGGQDAVPDAACAASVA
jgi:hypothetical protein